MSDFQILVKNKSGLVRDYILYVQTPNISGTGDVSTSVYMNSNPVPDNFGTARFNVGSDWFAITGTSRDRDLSNGVSIVVSDWEIAKLASNARQGTTVHMTAGPTAQEAHFDDALTAQETTEPGSFTIMTDHTFQADSQANQFIGLGARDFDFNIVPVAVHRAEPETSYIITPVPRYFITTGTYSPGEIIDPGRLDQSVEIDFTGKAATLAKVVHNNDGTWSITYN